MPILKTCVKDRGNGNLNHVDTVEFQGRPWLVAGGWLPADDKGFFRPVRLIRPIDAEFQAGGWDGKKWCDYILRQPIGADVLDGADPVPASQFEIIRSPDLSVEPILLYGQGRDSRRKPPSG
jgi:hypothetical protein